MNGGLFIVLYNEKTLSLYLKYGIYGFLMSPVFDEQPSVHSKHYAALSDYACCREGTHVFFFLERKIYYGGTITGNKEYASFFLNGDTSPLGRKASSDLFWDESNRYKPTSKKGVFNYNDKDYAQPFIIKFDKVDRLSNKFILSDELYLELGKYAYPLPSNTMQNMGFCTLTPGETEIALNLLRSSSDSFSKDCPENMIIDNKQKIFSIDMLEKNNFQNEAHMEFTLLANLKPIINLLPDVDDYVLCRQIPISPFKPFQMDRADICLYSKSRSLKSGTIPNVIIELKNKKADYHSYLQMNRYLVWLKKITNEDEFNAIYALILAPSFNINEKKIKDLVFKNKIKMYCLDTKTFYTF